MFIFSIYSFVSLHFFNVKGNLEEKQTHREGLWGMRFGGWENHLPCFARWYIWANYVWKRITPFENHFLVCFCSSFKVLGILSPKIVFPSLFVICVPLTVGVPKMNLNNKSLYLTIIFISLNKTDIL